MHDRVLTHGSVVGSPQKGAAAAHPYTSVPYRTGPISRYPHLESAKVADPDIEETEEPHRWFSQARRGMGLRPRRVARPGPKVTGSSPLMEIQSFNEWDPLEEIIVGRLDGVVACPQEPAYDACLESTHEMRVGWFGGDMENLMQRTSATASGNYVRGVFFGDTVDRDLLSAAKVELENFVRVLQNEGQIIKP